MASPDSPCITLLTDFGEGAWFVGSMKGVITSICPSARQIDITHQISPGNIQEAALVLKCAYRFFPPGTVHLAIVDPGVGTERGVVVMKGGGYLFLAPDNGVLSYLLAEIRERVIYRVNRKDLFLPEVSFSFHGRDIFAPVAAHLAGGLKPEELGPEVKNPLVFSLPCLRNLGKGRWLSQVIFSDRFGNLITTVSRKALGGERGLLKFQRLRLRVFQQDFILPLVTSYAAVSSGELLAIWGSCGYLELAVNGGGARERLGLKPGDEFILETVG